MQEHGQGLERVGPVVTFLDCWFGYKEDSVGATEWYEGPPCWWGLPCITETVRIRDLGVGRMGFAVPWAGLRVTPQRRAVWGLSGRGRTGT